MRGTLALVLAALAGGCGGREGPPTTSTLAAADVIGIWRFTRTTPSACVPDTISVRLTTAFRAPAAANQLSVSGDWTSNRDTRARGFTGEVATTGGFQLQLTLNEGVRGTMDVRGHADGSAYCSDGSSAGLTGERMR